MGAQRKPERRYMRRAAPPVKANAASFRGLEAAKAALCADTPGPTGEESLAQQEQWRREEESRRLAQTCLPLSPIA